MAFTLRRPAEPGTTRWEVVIDDGTTRPADHVIVTTPLAQAFSLLADADLELDIATFRVDYDRTICLLAVLDRPGAVAASGGEQPVDDVVQLHRRQRVQGRQRGAGHHVPRRARRGARRTGTTTSTPSGAHCGRRRDRGSATPASSTTR